MSRPVPSFLTIKWDRYPRYRSPPLKPIAWPTEETRLAAKIMYTSVHTCCNLHVGWLVPFMTASRRCLPFSFPAIRPPPGNPSNYSINQQELLESMDLAQYAVKGSEADWEAATKGISGKVGSVSIKSKVCSNVFTGCPRKNRSFHWGREGSSLSLPLQDFLSLFFPVWIKSYV